MSAVAETLHAVEIVEGVETEMVVTWYSDRVFVILTQLGKMGTLIHAKADDGCSGSDLTFSIRTLLGGGVDGCGELIARRLVEHISVHTDRPLLLAVALTRKDMEMARKVVDFAVKRISLSHSA